MSEDVYRRLAQVLDTLPSGFPATESGVEIKIVKKIFTPEEADLFCDLKVAFETPEEISRRTGRPLEGLAEMLNAMWRHGELDKSTTDRGAAYKMVPWIVGLYEYQLARMDREFAELCEEYSPHFGVQFITNNPPVFQTLPIEKTITVDQQALPYQLVSNIIENGRSFMVQDCICRKEKHLLEKGCDKPVEVCLSIGTEPDQFVDHPLGGRNISKDEANEVLHLAEEAGLVHNTYNVQSGQWFICNCCGCCCGSVRALRDFGIKSGINAHFFAEIDSDLCTACGTCADERCQVAAIDFEGDVYKVNRDKCIGCGLCISTCPAEAIQLHRKPPEERVAPPKDEQAWNDERAESRGVDYGLYR